MNSSYPSPTLELARKRRELAPAQQTAVDAFGKAVFAEGGSSAKSKQIIAVAVAHVTPCPYCIRGHTKTALRAGATQQELMDAIWVAAEKRPAALPRPVIYDTGGQLLVGRQQEVRKAVGHFLANLS